MPQMCFQNFGKAHIAYYGDMEMPRVNVYKANEVLSLKNCTVRRGQGYVQDQCYRHMKTWQNLTQSEA